MWEGGLMVLPEPSSGTTVVAVVVAPAGRDPGVMGSAVLSAGMVGVTISGTVGVGTVDATGGFGLDDADAFELPNSRKNATTAIRNMKPVANRRCVGAVQPACWLRLATTRCPLPQRVEQLWPALGLQRDADDSLVA